MKLVTKLKFFGIFATVLAVILGVVIYIRSAQVDLAIERDTVAREIVKEAFTLNILSDDYIRNRGERAKQQWVIQHATLNTSIAAYTVESEEEQHIITAIRQGQKDVVTHFLQLQIAIQNPSTVIRQEAERRLDSQLAIDTQNIVSQASTLAKINDTRLSMIRQSTYITMLATVVLLIILFIVIYILFARSINASMLTLTQGTKVLAGGDLNFRFRVKNRDEFGELAHVFNDMAKRLQQLDRAKSEFMNIASHQLRTPLTVIKWSTEALIKSGKVTDKKEKGYVEDISRGSERMIGIVDELLMVSQLELGTFHIEPVHIDLLSIVDQVLHDLHPQIKAKAIAVKKDFPEKVQQIMVDHKVTTIMQKLFSNAIKYSKEKGTIELELSVEGKNILIRVTDHGYGIPKDQQAKIFTKLFRAKNAVLVDPDGSGVGLYIVKTLVDAVGGKVWFTSEEHKGSSFFVTLPIEH